MNHRRVAKTLHDAKHPTKISVDRFGEVSPMERRDRGRRSAEIRASGEGRSVVHYYHADIVLLPTGRFDARDHALALAATSRWEDGRLTTATPECGDLRQSPHSAKEPFFRKKATRRDRGTALSCPFPRGDFRSSRWHSAKYDIHHCACGAGCLCRRERPVSGEREPPPVTLLDHLLARRVDLSPYCPERQTALRYRSNVHLHQSSIARKLPPLGKTCPRISKSL